MSFGRAILLGITAKGDPNTCFSAYPLCPRDPDGLVDYLNNHNGGFFQFFSNQRPYAPSRPYGRIQNGVHRLTVSPGRLQDPPVQQSNRRPKQLQFPNVYPPPITQNINSFRDPDYFRKEKLSLLFPNNEQAQEFPDSNLYDNKVSANSAVTRFYFPENINNGGSHQYYVTEQSSNPAINSFYFPANLNKGQSVESNSYNKKQSLNSSGKTTFFPNNNEEIVDPNLYNHRGTGDTLYFPQNEYNLNSFRGQKQLQDSKKITSPMKFPEQNIGEFRFEDSKIDGNVFRRPLKSFSGTNKPSFSFGYGRNQLVNLSKDSGKEGDRDKREGTDDPSTRISSDNRPNDEDYEVIQDNEDTVKISTDGSDLYSSED